MRLPVRLVLRIFEFLSRVATEEARQLQREIFAEAKPGGWAFNSMCAEMVRAKELERLHADQREYGKEYLRTGARGPRDGMADAVMEEALILAEQRAESAKA